MCWLYLTSCLNDLHIFSPHHCASLCGVFVLSSASRFRLRRRLLLPRFPLNNSSHTIHLSHLISHNYFTELISHTSSHTPYLIQLPHTPHLTLSCTTHLTQLISHTSSHINSSHTHNSSHTPYLTQLHTLNYKRV